MADFSETDLSIFLEDVNSLSEESRQILFILSVAGNPMNRSDIKGVAAELSKKLHLPQLAKLANITKLLRPLQDLGYVQIRANQFYTDQLSAWRVMRYAMESWEFIEPYAKILRAKYPTNMYYYAEGLILRRELPLAVIKGDGREFLQLRYKLLNYSWHQEEFEDPILTYFDNPFDPEKLQQFFPSFQAMICSMLLLSKLEYLMEVNAYQNFAKALLQKGGTGKEEKQDLVHAVLLSYFFQGELKQAQTFLAEYGSVREDLYPLFEGWMALLQGDEKTAVSLMNKAARIQKVRGYFPELEGIFHHYAYLFSQNYKKSETYGKRKFSLLPVHELLAGLSRFQQNQTQGDPTNFTEFSLHIPLYCLVAGQTSIWMDIPPADKIMSFLKQHIKHAEGHGYVFFAMLGHEILAQAEKGKAQQNALAKATALAKQMGIMPFLPRLQPKAAWERALEGLEALTNSAKLSKGPQNPTRLIWLFNPNTKHLQPIEQKARKNGGWTKGRNVSLKRLKEEGLPHMIEKDHEVVAALKKETYRDYYYYGRTEYNWDHDETLTALVGHPNLFHMDNPDIPLELVKKTPELIYEEKDGQLTIHFSPKIEEAGATLTKETNTRYQVMVVTDQQWAIAQMLEGRSSQFPAKAKSRLTNIIGKLAGTFMVQSSMLEEAEDLVKVKGNPIPHVLLMPIAEGFKAEVMVKPFGTEPPYFRAGEGRDNVVAEIKGVKTLVKRNLSTEKKRHKEVVNATPILQEIRPYRGEWDLPDPEDCLQLLVELEPLRTEAKVVIEWPKGESLKLAGKVDFGQFQLKVKKRRDWFGVEGQLKVDDELVLNLQTLMGLLDQEQDTRFVRLDDGRFLALTKSFQQRLEEMRGMLQEGRKGLQVHPVMAPNLEEWDDWGADLKVDAAWKKQIAKLKEARQLRPQIPNTLQADLRPYQEEGYSWLAQLAHWGVGACLADDMGLGKTLQAMALILDRAKNGPALVVAPASVVRNWLREIQRFAPTLNPLLLTDGNRAEIIADLAPFDVLIVSYNLMQIEIEGLGIVEFSTLVLDEAQAIKNRQTKRSKAAKQLQAEFRLLTTGTPIENHLGELWNLFDFLNPGLLGSQEHFNDRFANPIERDNDQEKRKQLRRLLRPFILRRRKSEVLDELPPKTEITLSVPLTEQEKAFYEALRLKAMEQLEAAPEDGPGENRFQILAQITRLRQACCHPNLVLPEADIPASKLRLFMEVVSELLENGHKALVFSQFVRFLKLVEEEVDKRGISYQYLDGQTPLKKREERVQAFQRGEGELFLISLKAGGVGLNLTAADYVIHLDPWWNPAVEDQASDRAHRIGQQRPVTVYRLVTENTIEEKIIKLHAEKRDLADSLLEGGETSAKMSSEELLELIRGDG